jgi:hypothetical protein
MTIRVAAAARNVALDAIVDRVDAGLAAGTIKVYTGTQPANADTALSGQTLLVTLTCADPAFAAAAAGAVDIDADPDLSATAAATGSAAWARVADSDGVTAFDGSVGTSGTDFIINSTSITSGQTVTLTTGNVTFPAS